MDELWKGILEPPLKGRIPKPRRNGITMLIDKGLSVNETRELLTMSAAYIDFIKLTFGTVAFYNTSTLQDKIRLAETDNVYLYPGGTFFEIAWWQGKTEKYFEKLVNLGFQWVEISDGSLEIPASARKNAIRAAISAGLNVITEIGKKNPQEQPDDERLIATGNADLNAGVVWVIVEARESGQGIGIYDSQGKVINEKLAKLSGELPLEKIIWEAPLKSQQARLINDFGPNVNLGNIPPAEALALEALRLGFRSDTWKTAVPFLVTV